MKNRTRKEINKEKYHKIKDKENILKKVFYHKEKMEKYLIWNGTS